MSSLTLNPSRPSSAEETERFIRSLCALAAVDRVARVEVRVFASDAELTFRIGELLASLWPEDLAPAPRHEVVWAKTPGPVGGVALTAFDVDGRVLHRQAA